MPRVYEKAPHELEAGEYGLWEKDQHWYGVPPETDLCANLGSHQIVVNEDETITVSPSILVSDGRSSWHGFLTRGEWTIC